MVLANGQRAGFFIGDGAGVGKGRQVSIFRFCTISCCYYLVNELLLCLCRQKSRMVAVFIVVQIYLIFMLAKALAPFSC